MCYSIIPRRRVPSPGAEYNSAPPKITFIKFGNLIYLFIMSFILPGITRGQSDTSICDNGGFESGFTYYTGDTSSFFRQQKDGGGSESCTPTLGGNPCVFGSSSLPVSRRFEIVGSGTDTNVNVSRVIFGSHSLMINSSLNYFDNGQENPCNHKGDINRIIKRFLVTEENRDFTVWYCAILEKPGGHVDQQPFFSIRCDLAPNSDLCYDGIALPGRIDSVYEECKLGNYKYEVVNYTDWACQRIHIPKEEVGNIATIEFTASDCAEGGHWGYAYID